MKIIRLEADSIKRISAVAIEPTGNVVEITGKNGQGKSSILDSIVMALEGAGAIPQAPIRRGSDKGSITLRLGDPAEPDKQLIVTRKFRRTADKEGAAKIATEVVVEAASGARFKSPQAMLDSFYSSLSFDPYDWTRQKPAEQFEQLRRFAPGVDFAAIDGQNMRDYEKRRDVNRDAARLKAAAAAIIVPDDTPEAPIDESQIVAELARAGEHNAQVTAARTGLGADRERIEVLRHNAAEARDSLAERVAAAESRRDAQIAKIRAEYESQIADIRLGTDKYAGEQEAEAKELESGIRALQERAESPMIDSAALQRRIAEARATNGYVTKAAEKSRLAREAAQLEAQAQALTDAMTARERSKADAIAAAKLPVPGLGFGKDDKGQPIVTMNGLPFDQASDAEQLRASIAIAMAQNPKLRVIRVRDGNGLDADAMALLAKMADEANCQVWIETVRSDGRVAFVIEDGHLKGDVAAEPASDDPPTTNNATLL